MDKLELRIHTLEYHMANLKLKCGENLHTEPVLFFFPELFCYARSYSANDPPDKAFLQTFHEAVDKGYSVNRRISPFTTFDRVGNRRSAQGYSINVPIIEPRIKTDVIFYSRQATVSVMVYGNENDLSRVISEVYRLIKKRHIKVAGNPRVIGAINSFPNQFEKDKWVSQICVPVEDFL